MGLYNNSKNKIFELENNLDGTYSIKCLSLGIDLGFDSDKISFLHRNENAISFYIIGFDFGYYLFHATSWGVIDLSYFKTHNGANIGKRGKRNNSEAQQWKLLIHL